MLKVFMKLGRGEYSFDTKVESVKFFIANVLRQTTFLSYYRTVCSTFRNSKYNCWIPPLKNFGHCMLSEFHSRPSCKHLFHCIIRINFANEKFLQDIIFQKILGTKIVLDCYTIKLS